MTRKSKQAKQSTTIEVVNRSRKWGIPPRRLAEETAAALGMDGDDREMLTETAVALMGWLRHKHRGAYWDRLDINEIVRQSAFRQREIREQFLFFTTTLLGFACLNGHLSPVVGRRYMNEIQQLSRNPATVTFATTTGDQLASLIG